MPIHNVHDSGYKKLFSNRTIFQQLIQSFVDEPWVKDLDFSQAETLDKSFVADHYKTTESDLIYRVQLQGRDVYIYLLLEFQSSVDRFMAVRVAYYALSFYMDFINNQKPVEKLPALFPIVVYNGTDRWTAPERLADLVESEPFLGDYGVQCRYFKIAENEFDREQLLSIRNIVSTLFLAEAHFDIDLLIEEFVSVFVQEEDRRAISLFLNWFKQVTVHGRVSQADFDKFEQEYHSVREVREMLIESMAKEREQWRHEGFQQGVEEGIEAGIKQGIEQGIEQGAAMARLMLEEILHQRLGELPSAVQVQLRACTLNQLNLLVHAALYAQTWAEFEAALADQTEPPADTEEL